MIEVRYAIKLQERLSKEVIKEDRFDYDKIRYIAGVDVAYSKDKRHAYACMVIIDKVSLSLLKYKCKEFTIDIPYIPGLLFIREGNCMLNLLKDESYDLVMVDGNGILHPRRFGLASYVGFMLNKPSIGVAKKLLCGKVEGDKVVDKGEVLGSVLIIKGKKLYISIGNMISLDTATRLVREVTKDRLPEPIRLADKLSKDCSRDPTKILR